MLGPRELYSAWGWIVYELGYTECVGATLRFMWTATTYEVSVVYGILKISQRLGHTRPGCLAGGSRTTYSAAGCDKLRDIVETEGMTWAERILRPEAGMVLHHTVTEQAHDRWLTLRQRSTHKAYDKTALIEREEPEWQQTKTHSRSLSCCALGLHPRPGQNRRRGTSRQTQRTRHR